MGFRREHVKRYEIEIHGTACLVTQQHYDVSCGSDMPATAMGKVRPGQDEHVVGKSWAFLGGHFERFAPGPWRATATWRGKVPAACRPFAACRSARCRYTGDHKSGGDCLRIVIAA